MFFSILFLVRLLIPQRSKRNKSAFFPLLRAHVFGASHIVSCSVIIHTKSSSRTTLQPLSENNLCWGSIAFGFFLGSRLDFRHVDICWVLRLIFGGILVQDGNSSVALRHYSSCFLDLAFHSQIAVHVFLLCCTTKLPMINQKSFRKRNSRVGSSRSDKEGTRTKLI